jgi:hypothetical protein
MFGRKPQSCRRSRQTKVRERMGVRRVAQAVVERYSDRYSCT